MALVGAFLVIVKADGSFAALPRKMHSQTVLLACGSYNDHADGLDGTKPLRSCETFNLQTGEWEESHSMQHARFHHGSWQSPKGVMLLGGGKEQASRTTAEIMTGFTIEYTM